MKTIKRKKAQIWSVDIMIATFIFLIAFILGIVVINKVFFQAAGDDLLIKENKLISDTLSTDTKEYSFVQNDQVNASKLETFSNMDYNELKRELGLKSDFCIHFKDEEGNVVPIGEIVLLGDPDSIIQLNNQEFYCNGTSVEP